MESSEVLAAKLLEFMGEKRILSLLRIVQQDYVHN